MLNALMRAMGCKESEDSLMTVFSPLNFFFLNRFFFCWFFSVAAAVALSNHKSVPK